MIKIAKLVKKTVNHTLERNLQIASMIASSDFLSSLFNPDHPLFHFELLSYTTCLNYRIYLRNTDISILASSLLYSFQNEDPDTWQRYFMLNYTSAVRALLFSREDTHDRDAIRFFTDGQIDFNAIIQFIELICTDLPTKLEVVNAEDALYLTFRHEAMESMILKLDKAEMNRIYGQRQTHEFESHELIRDYLMMQITRVFINAQPIEQMYEACE